MMVVDASAVLAILLQESEADSFAAILAETTDVIISPVNLWEVMVRARSARGEAGANAAENLVAALGLHVMPTTIEHARLAIEASVRFGRGTPAALNMGDCFAYALAKAEACGLLFKGDDFKRTDIEPVQGRISDNLS
jgi:ribonuclease VapC